ncbi:MAG: YqcI/YcgG family protein, partial [Nitrospiraceae bacterium]
MTGVGIPLECSSFSLEKESSDSAHLQEEIRAFISQDNYPYVAAIQSVVRNDHMIATYGQFGSGTHWQQLRVDLLRYLEVQRATHSRYMSFWAVYSAPNHIPANEGDFEEHLWRELS